MRDDEVAGVAGFDQRFNAGSSGANQQAAASSARAAPGTNPTGPAPVEFTFLRVVYNDAGAKKLYDGYDVLDAVDAGTTAADAKLEQVVYKDLTTWDPLK